MKTSLQKQTKHEVKVTHRVPKTTHAATSDKNRFKGMSKDLEKVEPLYIPGYKIRG
ncbi:hypothetical protein D3C87_880590 [compost metagenome]